MASTIITLSSGEELEIQSSEPLMSPPGITEASPIDRIPIESLKVAMNRVADLANEAVSELRDKIGSCKEASVEFGISLGGKTGLVLVEGTANANFKLTIKW